MQDVNTFLGTGWDFVGEYENGPSDEWAEPPGGGYMILWWQLEPLPALPGFSGGTGQTNDPYLISTADDLNRMGHNSRLMEAHFRLINDIDLSGLNIWSIGSNKALAFAGVFDGNGHEISNFSWDSNGIDPVGLFSYVDGQDTEIKDLGLRNPDIAAGTGTKVGVGSLVGWAIDGTISGCYVDGGSVSGGDGVRGLMGCISFATVSNCHAAVCNVSGNSRVGGLAGSNEYGLITNCYSAAGVSGGSIVGGLVGDNWMIVTNCHSTGSVSSGGNYVGGLVGEGGTIINCYSTAVVGGNDKVGGLVGGSYYGAISNCYSTGSVSGNQHVGGLLGRSRGGTVTNCYSEGDVTGGEDVGGLVGLNYYYGATISKCYSTGSASGATGVGGLVGENYQSANIDNCYAHGDAMGVQSVGGLVGKNSTYVASAGALYYSTITNCYSVGAATAFIGDTDIGGLVGINDAKIFTSFWNTETSTRSNMCGSVGTHGSGGDDAFGKTTAQMQEASTFIAFGGWDFVAESDNGSEDIWDICEDKYYPRLAWQILDGDIVCPYGVDVLDLALLCEQWLSQELTADRSPQGGDGIVNLRDWAFWRRIGRLSTTGTIWKNLWASGSGPGRGTILATWRRRRMGMGW